MYPYVFVSALGSYEMRRHKYSIIKCADKHSLSKTRVTSSTPWVPDALLMGNDELVDVVEGGEG